MCVVKPPVQGIEGRGGTGQGAASLRDGKRRSWPGRGAAARVPGGRPGTLHQGSWGKGHGHQHQLLPEGPRERALSGGLSMGLGRRCGTTRRKPKVWRGRCRQGGYRCRQLLPSRTPGGDSQVGPSTDKERELSPPAAEAHGSQRSAHTRLSCVQCLPRRDHGGPLSVQTAGTVG